MTFKSGDLVRITYKGRTVNGEVLMACPTGLSLALRFEEHLGGYNRLMPVLWLDHGYVDLLEARPVEITVQSPLFAWPT